ncbi:hypothetical protein V7x_42670 [Crateriforma conspicua]|uniref:Replication protein n=1 Tax=Crateriforma conspicua TaxID=2527996 RepID=A0A5C6FMZ8_9PLAN|nr:hypothetical protein [Crateriforma conspicua]TWU62532.1 hypothetical protein V7x_42670 [Crateriforma conspicua]
MTKMAKRRPGTIKGHQSFSDARIACGFYHTTIDAYIETLASRADLYSLRATTDYDQQVIKSAKRAMTCCRLFSLHQMPSSEPAYRPVQYCRDTHQCVVCQALNARNKIEARRKVINYIGTRCFEIVVHFDHYDDINAETKYLRSAKVVTGSMSRIKRYWKCRQYNPPQPAIVDYLAGIHVSYNNRQNYANPHVHFAVNVLADESVAQCHEVFHAWENALAQDLASKGLPVPTETKISHKGLVVNSAQSQAAQRRRGYKCITQAHHLNFAAYVLRTSEKHDKPGDPPRRHQSFCDAKIKITTAAARCGVKRPTTTNRFQPKPGKLLLFPFQGTPVEIDPQKLEQAIQFLEAEADEIIGNAVPTKPTSDLPRSDRLNLAELAR